MKLRFKSGMVFRSKTNPHFDMILTYCCYCFDDDFKLNKYGTIFSWCNVNKEEFTKFTNNKLGIERAKKSTFPYAFSGSCGLDALKRRLKKYDLEFVGFSEDVITVYNDNEYEYSDGLKELTSVLL